MLKDLQTPATTQAAPSQKRKPNAGEIDSDEDWGKEWPRNPQHMSKVGDEEMHPLQPQSSTDLANKGKGKGKGKGIKRAERKGSSLDGCDDADTEA